MLPFYLWYLAEYSYYRLIRKMAHQLAYRALLHEREAYAFEENPGYLKSRRPYAWLRK